MTRQKVILPLLVVGSLVVAPELADAQEDQVETFSYTRIYEDSTGQSHFSDEEMELELMAPGPGIPPTAASSPIRTIGMRLFCPPAGGEADWHPVPAPLFNLIVSGEFEIEVSDGETRRFGPGSLILGEDTEGQGHRTRVVGTGRACFAMIQVPELQGGMIRGTGDWYNRGE